MEVAIAVAVVLIGVLALFALITAGLDASAKSVADTQAALFADNVFNGLAAASQAAAEKGVVGVLGTGPVVWRQFWNTFSKSSSSRTTNDALSVAAPVTWTGPTTDKLLIWGSDNVRDPIETMRFEVKPQRSALAAGIVNNAFRYQVMITFSSPILPLETLANNRVSVVLKIWDGEFSSAASDSDALIFYSEFDNPGDL